MYFRFQLLNYEIMQPLRFLLYLGRPFLIIVIVILYIDCKRAHYNNFIKMYLQNSNVTITIRICFKCC